MKTHYLRRSFVITLLACLTSPLLAQSDLPPLPSGYQYSQAGFISASGGGGGGGFQPDDSGPPGGFGGNGGSGGFGGCTDCFLPNPGTNLWLIITLASNQETVTVTLSNTVSNVNYLLLVNTNLYTPWVTNQSLLATSTVTVAAPYWTYDYPAVFFKALAAPAPTNGTLKWSAFISSSGYDAYEGSGLDSSPAVSGATGEILMTIANNSTPSNSMIFAVDPVFGEIQWINSIFQLSLTNTVTFQNGELTGSAAVAPNGMIYVGGLDGNLYSLYPDGVTNWVRPAGAYDAIYSTPAIGSNGLIYVASDEAEESRAGSVVTGVTAFNTNGTTNWFFVPQDLFYSNGGDVDSSSVVGADGSIYFIGEGSRLYALTAGGQLKWFLPLPGDGEPASSPALAADGTIVVGSGFYHTYNVPSPYLYDVNPDGSLNWIFNVTGYGGGSIIQNAPTIDQNGVVYVGSASLYQDQIGCVFAINPDGSSKWIFTNNNNYVVGSPAVAKDGTVYVGDEGGQLYAISNGVAVWTYSTSGAIVGSPAILPDGSVLIGSEDGNLYSLWGNAPPATNAPWPMFQQNMSHTAQQTSVTVTNAACGAPFVFNGGYVVNSSFSFSMTGTPGSSNWNVYASTNLANTNWIVLASNLVMNSVTGNTNFTDTGVAGVTNKFYIVGRSNCNSQAIGFVNQIVTPGTNLVADQLYQVDENILNAEFMNAKSWPMNTLNALFLVSNAWGSAQSGTRIYKWTGNGFAGDTNTFLFGSPGWVGSGDLTLLPGSSVIMNNTNAHSFTNTFVGLIRNEQIFHITSKTNYLCATVPVAGNVTNITGYPAHAGDILRFWNTNTQSFVAHTNISGTWSNGGLTNNLKIGEGFVLVTTNTFSWTNIWE